ncbi:FAD binding domain-containing protein [Jatrophihabitans sp. YIM 134969]
MKPPAFDFAAPTTLQQAATLLAEADDAKVLAGGQSLIPLLNLRFASPAMLIDLNRLHELNDIEVGHDELRIGALVRHTTVEHHPEIARRHPLLTQAMTHVAHPQIRNRGTIGGTTAHADPAAEVPVVLLMSDARVTAHSTRGTREIDVDDLFVSIFTTSLEPDEILTEVILPNRPGTPGGTTGASFQEFARRHGDYAIGGAAACIELDSDKICRSARIGLLGAGMRPEESKQAAALIEGQHITTDLIHEAAHIATRDIEPMGNVHGDPDYRRHVIREMTERALRAATNQAEEALR